MKVIFLVGEAKTVVDFWGGKTKKGTRMIGVSEIKLSGASVFDATIIERKNQERIFRFIFIVTDKGKIERMTKILEELDVSSSESAVIITDAEKEITREMGINKMPKKRYHFGSCGFLVFLKRKVQNKDVNELASVLFYNREKEVSRKDGKLRALQVK